MKIRKLRTKKFYNISNRSQTQPVSKNAAG